MTVKHQYTSENLSSITNLVQLLNKKALHQPDFTVYKFLENGENESDSLTYQQLDKKARAIAAKLQSFLDPGERVLLLYPSGLEFICAFFGCLYAGVIAVPAYPPKRNQKMSRLSSIVTSCEAKAVLTTNEQLTNIKSGFAENPQLAALICLASDDINSNNAENWYPADINSETCAFLQYTSGSTGMPKGVMVSHGNLLHNLEYIRIAFEFTPESTKISWLPSFHDMGLIGSILEPLYVGCLCVLMSPVAFLQQPIRWLQAISRYKGTHSGGPNFGYNLCIEKITVEQRQELDLSSWHNAFNGAEPICQDTLEKFTQTFADCGFGFQFFYPCYGMAEVTLLASSGYIKNNPVYVKLDAQALLENRIVKASNRTKDIKYLVGCGFGWLDTKIVIVNPETLKQCNDNEVGEIWLSSKSVASGYWNLPEETNQTFHAYIKDTKEGPFLRTGDLGFLQDNELFVTGRLKDLIIIRGSNHYPQDIEITVSNSHPALRKNCSAAFSVDINGEEKLVVVNEVEREYLRKLDVNEVIKNIRISVTEEHDLEIYAILLLKTGNIPKTSSGKIQRRACRAGFLSGSLNVVHDWSINPESKAEYRHLLTSVKSLEQQVTSQNQLQSQTTNSIKSNPQKHSIEEIQAWLISKIATSKNLNPQDIDLQQPFSSYGLDSVTAITISGDLENWLGRQLPATLIYDYPYIKILAQYLAKETEQETEKVTSEKTLLPIIAKEEIAIIGIGCRFPGANNPKDFWELLRSGVDAISEVPFQRWDKELLYNSQPATTGKMSTKWGGFLPQVDQFDPHFFGISPREAERMDPQQRLLLEVTWEALENAGIAPNSLAGSKTGVFIGISNNDYSHFQLEDVESIDIYTGTGNALSIAANRLSYMLDLRGPSLALDTACSSSLVAVHLAQQSLHSKECNLAIVGGVNLILSPQLTITFSQAQMMAADGRCKTFDASADGYVRSEGSGVVILKRLSDAIRDKDNILAVIKGSAVNQDGRSNGITAPNGPSQEVVIQDALENAGISANNISYVETHGTGTALGDPIEIESLKKVLQPGCPTHESCIIGSVKANIGHLEAAAGIASLIKTVLCLQNEEIPPQLHFNHLNPHISLSDTSFLIPKKLHPWTSGLKPRFAGISSFGFGGTNAHVIIGEAPYISNKLHDENTDIKVVKEVVKKKSQKEFERPLHVLTLSAKTDKALLDLVSSYEEFLQAESFQVNSKNNINYSISLPNICFTANTGRSHFDYRLAIVAESNLDLQSALNAFTIDQANGKLSSGKTNSQKPPKVAFLFTGQGSQYLGMGRQLYEEAPVFRQSLQHCDEILRPYLQKSLLEIIYPQRGETSLLNDTAYTQPALFAIEYALSQLWKSWGVIPDIVMGHSLGEYVAATIAGVFSLEDALKLVALRGRLMQMLPNDGIMLSVLADKDTVSAAIKPYESEVAIATNNGVQSFVISGKRQAVEAVRSTLTVDGVKTRQLQVSHAFHSPLMEPILKQFMEVAAAISYSLPQIKLVSNVTGDLVTQEIANPDYWCQHIRQTVQFAAGMKAIYHQGYELFVEIGSGTTLLEMGRNCLPINEKTCNQANDNKETSNKKTWLPSLNPGESEWYLILKSLAELYVQGVHIDWHSFDSDYARKRVVLPTYPWQKSRYWFEKTNKTYNQIQPLLVKDIKIENFQIENQQTSLEVIQSNNIQESISSYEYQEYLTNYICSQVSTVTGLNQSLVDPQKKLFDLGMDSLSYLELKDILESNFKCTLSSTLIFKYPTIEDIVNYLMSEVLDINSLKQSPEHIKSNSIYEKDNMLTDTQYFSPEEIDINASIIQELEQIELLLNKTYPN